MKFLSEKDQVYSREDYVEYSELSESSPGVKHCVACGKLFVPKSGKQKNCLRTHFKKCVVCGKEFDVNLSNGLKQLPVCCSKECRAVYKAFIAKSPEVVEKSKKTNLSRYGVENGAQSTQSRAKIKSKKPIVLTCVVCGKQFEVPSGSNHKKCCSKECLHVLQSQNNHKRSVRSGYFQECVDRMERVKQDREQGFVNASQRPEVRQKQSEAMKLVLPHNHSEETKLKISEGIKTAYQDPNRRMSILAKRSLSTQEHYGVDNPFQSEEVKEKIRSTNLQKYGVEYACQNPEVRKKLEFSREHTMLQKYGVVSPNQVPKFQHKRAVTIFENANGDKGATSCQSTTESFNLS